jgi:hypothetical protein
MEVIMRTIRAPHAAVLAAVVLFAIAAPARAQQQASATSDPIAAERAQGTTSATRGPLWGYVFGGGGWQYPKVPGPGGSSVYGSDAEASIQHAGLGLEFQLGKSPLAASVEGGVMTARGYPAFTMSANVSALLGRAPAQRSAVVPFVTGGFALSPDNEAGVNMGGGVTWWTRGGRGVRIEVREHRWSMYRILEFRVGLDFGRR